MCLKNYAVMLCGGFDHDTSFAGLFGKNILSGDVCECTFCLSVICLSHLLLKAYMPDGLMRFLLLLMVLVVSCLLAMVCMKVKQMLER